MASSRALETIESGSLRLNDRRHVSSVADMRNPIRLKNLNARFVPLYVLGVAILFVHPPRLENAVAALPLILLGVGLRSWGAGHLVKNHALTITGPYAHLRHPLYLGTILVASGFAIWVGGWLTLVLLALIWPWFALHYFPRKERSESARLEATYGERFAHYRAAVPALWPNIRGWHEVEAPGGDRSAGGWKLDRFSDNNELGTVLAITFGILVFWWRSVTG
jgi:protein-S-isoprenylcysteine O-methyltransferase Ste14